MINTLVYDLDGTLVDFRLDIAGMKENIINSLLEQGISRRYLRAEEPLYVIFDKSWTFLQGVGWSREAFDLLVTRVLKEVEPFELEAAKSTSLVQGAETVLKHFKQQKMSQAVLTNVPSTIALFTLNRFNIAGFFDRIMGRDEMPMLKPDPRGLGKLLRFLKRETQNAVMIGDSIIDILAAKQNNVTAIGVTNGINRKEELLKAGANRVISSLQELPNTISEMNGK